MTLTIKTKQFHEIVLLLTTNICYIKRLICFTINKKVIFELLKLTCSS